MSWLELFGATAIDVAATYALAASDGWRRPLVGLVAVAGYMLAIYLFGLALAALGPGICYAFFGAVGIAAVAVLGFVFGPDTLSSLRLASLAMTIFGVVGIALTSGVGARGSTR